MSRKRPSDNKHAEHAHSRKATGVDRVVKVLVDELVNLLVFHKAPQRVQDCFRSQVSKHLAVKAEPDFVRRGKNLLCFFKAVYLNSPIPDMEGYVMEGHFKRWIKRRLRTKCRANDNLFGSIFKAKNAAEGLGFDAVVSNMRKHAHKVSQPSTSRLDDVQEAIDSIRPMLEDIRRKMKEKVSRLVDWKQISRLSASNKSCLELSIARGGQVGELITDCFGEDSCLVAPCWPFHDYPGRSYEYVNNEDFYKEGTPLWKKMQKVVVNGRTPKSCKSKKYVNEPFTYEYYLERLDFAERQEDPVPSGLIRNVDSEGKVTYVTEYSYPRSEAQWDAFVEDMCLQEVNDIDNELPIATVVAVCEPFKVRLITKSEARRQYCLRWFQKKLHGIMKKYWCFQLMGKAPTTHMLMETANHASLVGEGPLGHESSDFSGASDNPPDTYVAGVVEPILDVLPVWMQLMVRKSNGHHILVYPEKYEGRVIDPPIENVEQCRGTLMGRITSFPILCLMVLGAHVANLRRCGDKRDFWDLIKGVLVNGDDRYTVSRQSTYKNFWNFCSLLQMEESIGKSYFHPSYCNINSQSYEMKLNYATILSRGAVVPAYQHHCWKVPILPMGLFAGRKKIKGEEFDPTVVLNDVLGGCINPRMERDVCMAFLRRHKKLIDKNLCGRNLFLPVNLGGMGQRPPRLGVSGGWKVRMTDDQRAIATCLYKEFHLDERPPRRPYKDETITPSRPAWDVKGKLTFWEQVRLLQQGMEEPAINYWEYYERRIEYLTLSESWSRRRLARLRPVATATSLTYGTTKCWCCEELVFGSGECKICLTLGRDPVRFNYDISPDFPLESLSDSLGIKVNQMYMSRDIGHRVFLERSKRIQVAQPWVPPSIEGYVQGVLYNAGFSRCTSLGPCEPPKPPVREFFEPWTTSSYTNWKRSVQAGGIPA